MTGRTLLAAAIMVLAASCTKDVRLAVLEESFDSPALADVPSKSRVFAEKNGLKFENRSAGDGRTELTLKNGQVEIEASIDNRRLRIVAYGPPKPQAADLAFDYINKVAPNGPHIKVHSPTP